MVIIPDRLIHIMALRGLSQTRLAQDVGVSSSMIGKLARGESRGSTHLFKIAKALETSPEYLTGLTEDPDVGAFVPPSAAEVVEKMGLTMIPEIDLHFALGGGSYADGPVSTSLVPYRTDWLQRITRGTPADVFLTRGDGDSMMPTILDDDDVVVNRADRIITKQDRIWALGYGDLVAIKRVRRLASGVFQLLSDNPNVTPIEAYEEELRVIGRVIWIGRRM
jgi:phage repressor protein C with HTH and peptisase S24 domain